MNLILRIKLFLLTISDFWFNLLSCMDMSLMYVNKTLYQIFYAIKLSDSFEIYLCGKFLKYLEIVKKN